MAKAKITLEVTAPLTYAAGDYAYFYGNGGSGSIDYSKPLAAKIELAAPANDFARYPWRSQAWPDITLTVTASICGNYKFALKCFDALGNPQPAAVEELTVPIHIAPAAPSGLKKNSYDPVTGVLALDAI